MGSTGPSDRDRELTVLVTGFGPFLDKFPVNPSFEITKSLPEFLPADSSHDTAIRIIPYSEPIRVAYDEVRELIPKLHEGYSASVDVVMHIGMASGRRYYCAERYAHRDGYSTLTWRVILHLLTGISQEQRLRRQGARSERWTEAVWRLSFYDDDLAGLRNSLSTLANSC